MGKLPEPGADSFHRQSQDISKDGSQQDGEQGARYPAGHLAGEPDGNYSECGETKSVSVELVQVPAHHGQFLHDVRRHVRQAEPHEVRYLPDEDQDGDAEGEADDHGIRDEFNYGAQPQHAEDDQYDPGHYGGDEQAVVAEALDNAVDDDDEGAGGAADLDAAAAESGDYEAGDDGGVEPLVGGGSGGYGESYGQGQGDDPHDEPGGGVLR